MEYIFNSEYAVLFAGFFIFVIYSYFNYRIINKFDASIPLWQCFMPVWNCYLIIKQISNRPVLHFAAIFSLWAIAGMRLLSINKLDLMVTLLLIVSLFDVGVLISSLASCFFKKNYLNFILPFSLGALPLYAFVIIVMIVIPILALSSRKPMLNNGTILQYQSNSFGNVNKVGKVGPILAMLLCFFIVMFLPFNLPNSLLFFKQGVECTLSRPGYFFILVMLTFLLNFIFFITILAKYKSNYTHVSFLRAKRILSYISGTALLIILISFFLTYSYIGQDGIVFRGWDTKFREETVGWNKLDAEVNVLYRPNDRNKEHEDRNFEISYRIYMNGNRDNKGFFPLGRENHAKVIQFLRNHGVKVNIKISEGAKENLYKADLETQNYINSIILLQNQQSKE